MTKKGDKKMTLQEIRLAKNFTQMQVAEIIGTTRQHIGDWENAIKKPSLEYANRLAIVYNVKMEDIYKAVNSTAKEKEIERRS